MTTRARHYSARAHEVSQRRAVDRLLDRANAEGRTRVRCHHCGETLERAMVGATPFWLTDDGGAYCAARAAGGDRPVQHEPAE